jgi:hypothetical protein
LLRRNQSTPIFDRVASTSTGADIAYQREKLINSQQIITRFLNYFEANKEEMIQLQKLITTKSANHTNLDSVKKKLRFWTFKKELALYIERERAISKDKETIQNRNQRLENAISKLEEEEELANTKGLLTRPGSNYRNMKSSLKFGSRK